MAVLRERRVGPPRVAQFRETHHRVARLIAAGLRDSEVSRMTGYAPTRIGQFKQDPAFLQLVAEYRGKVDEAYIASQDEFYDTATSNMLRAERMIEAHLDKAEDESDLIPLKTLMGITADRADRFGYGKKSTQSTEITDFAKMMEQLASRSGRSNVIDAPTPVKATQPPQPDSSQEPSFAGGTGFRRRIQGRQG